MELSQTYTQTLFVMAHLPDSEAPLFLLVARPLTVHPRNIRSVRSFILVETHPQSFYTVQLLLCF